MAVRMNIQIDTRGLDDQVKGIEKKLAYSTSQALNKTALEIQVAERANLDRLFTIRNPQFMYRLIKIFNFASPTKDRPYVDMGIDDTKARLLLPQFEEGGIRHGFVGASAALPVIGGTARPSLSSRVPLALTFERLDFQRGADGLLEGKKRTYIVPGVGVFQRSGSGKGQVSKLIYSFRTNLQLPPKLRFGIIADQMYQETFNRYFDIYFNQKDQTFS
jgi:hypothetical protein